MSRTKKSGKKKPPSAIQCITFTDHPLHETCWAIASGPGGLVHISVCCEQTGGGTAHLYAYDVNTRALTHTLDVARAIGEDPADGHAAHGKVHFALCPSADGTVYAATHCTTPPLGDTIWNPITTWNDLGKSFTGAHLFRYDPRTGAFTDYGIPFPNQGIPALELDESLGRLVGVTYPRARLFFIEKDGTGFVDAGRISEGYPLCLILDGKGYAYTSDSYGYIVRINLRKRSSETLASRIPGRRDSSGRYNCMCDATLGPEGFIYGVGYAVPNLFRFEPVAAGQVRIDDLGPYLPSSDESIPKGIVFADDGRLYGCLYGSADGPHLARFDPSARTSEDLGVIVANGEVRAYWRCVKGSDGKLYAGECGRRPVSMIIIDPTRFS